MLGCHHRFGSCKQCSAPSASPTMAYAQPAPDGAMLSPPATMGASPRKKPTCVPVATSQREAQPSAPVLSTSAPAGCSCRLRRYPSHIPVASCVTAPLCASTVCCCTPASTSQIMTQPSWSPVATRKLPPPDAYCAVARAVSGARWPLNTAAHSQRPLPPPTEAHTRAVPSAEAVTRRAGAPSGGPTATTPTSAPSCPDSTAIHCPVPGCHTLAVPSTLAVTTPTRRRRGGGGWPNCGPSPPPPPPVATSASTSSSSSSAVMAPP
mmetsp:Transcript_13058/g.33046  ORF Transcript_13058/g.33046 Transcript_13058/m.33046 type:complete len:265 (+) Transcript_13058:103-897(+)